ncbi:GntR family transcriptional regulator [Microbacteriaceae bacterium VKM Ac-2854]|nr:GntR family transcriptional regulator [Microbacteriaceae bacterium VKM Ac-2854]
MTDTAAALYARVRSAILELDLVPGQRLTERGLEAEFGASRTPVRAALLRLEADGLVRRDARAWAVTPIDLDEIRALAELREAVETAAVRLACERADDRAVAALQELLESFRPAESDAVQLGTDFHSELARLSGNEFLVAAVQGAMTRLARTRWLEVRTAASREQAWSEHAHILDCVARREAEAAVAAVTAHIRETNARLVAVLAADRRALGARGLRLVGG